MRLRDKGTGIPTCKTVTNIIKLKDFQGLLKQAPN